MAERDHDHLEAVPMAIGAVVERLGELEVVIGPKATGVVAAVRTMLIGAMAARDRGDVPGAMRDIGKAMDQLAGLADQLDPAEASLMRLLSQSFRRALLGGDTAQAKQDAAVMFAKSGAVERDKK